MKKKLLNIIFFVLSISIGQAQNLPLLKTIEVEAKTIEVDVFNNFYIIEDYKVSKYNSEGTLLFSYNEIEDGLISSFDISNPLKPLIYCKDFGILKVLDHKLHLINSINFSDKNLDFIETISSANGDSYWAFDKLDFKLLKLNNTFNKIYSSESFLDLFSENISVLKILENEQNVFVLEKKKLFLFDQFGNYNKTLPIVNIEDFQIVNNEIIFFDSLSIYSYNLKTLETSEMLVPKHPDLKKGKIVKGSLLLLTKKMLYIYSTD